MMCCSPLCYGPRIDQAAHEPEPDEEIEFLATRLGTGMMIDSAGDVHFIEVS